MHILSSFFALLTFLIHLYIFALESLFWKKPYARKIFRQSEEQAELTYGLAFNQGFYNLFLALGILIGLFLNDSGVILTQFSLASILAASIVLYLSNPKMLRGTIIQGLPPLLYFIFSALR